MAKSDSVIPAVRDERNGRIGLYVLSAVVAGAAAWFAVSQLGGSSPVAESGPVIYTSSEYGYEVEFPGEPAEVVETQLQADVELTTTSVTWTGTDRAHLVSAVEMPEFLVPGGVTEAVLLAALDGAAGEVDGSVEEYSFVDVDGEPGIAGLVAAGDIKMRVVIVIQRDILLMVGSINGTVAQHDAFLQTFALGT